MEKADNWIMFNLPENCTSISVSFKREIAEMQVEKFGATPLYGLDGKKAEQLPVEIFITYGGTLAPDQRCHFDSMRQDNETEEKLKWLKSIGAAEFQEPIRYIYTFPDYNGAFNLSERYIAETTLEELKAQYEKNKTYVQEIIRSKKTTERKRGSEMKQLKEKAVQIAGKYFDLVEKRIDSAKELTGNELRDIYEGIQMMGHITATLERFSRMEGVSQDHRPVHNARLKDV